MRPKGSSRRPGILWPLVAAMAFLSLGGLTGGLAMITDPTGTSIGADPGWLRHTPVSDFLLPGLFILVVYGCAVAACIVGLIWRIEPGRLRRVDARLAHTWAWVGTIAIGAVLVLWIAFELVIMSDVIWLQPALVCVGLLMIGVPSVPSMRRWYAVRAGERRDPSCA